ncbi:MAG: DNA translocase FtsK [Firmicutes bacterium]|nr:DNA translocase FtsK [Bacillota bacterium]
MSRYTSRNVGGRNGVLETRKKWGIALLAVSLVLLFFSCFNLVPAINMFLLGSFGLAVFPVLLVSIVISVALVMRKRYVFPKRYAVSLAGVYFCLILVLQQAISGGLGIAEIYAAKTTAGGVLMGLFAYGLSAVVTPVGVYVLAAIAAIVCVTIVLMHLNTIKGYNKIEARTVSLPDFDVKELKSSRVSIKVGENFAEPEAVKPKEQVQLTLNAKMEKTARERAKERLGMVEGMSVQQMREIEAAEQKPKNTLFSDEFIKAVKSTSRGQQTTGRAAQPVSGGNNQSLFDLLKQNERKPVMPPAAEGSRPPKFVYEEAKPIPAQPVFNAPKMDNAVKENIKSFVAEPVEPAPAPVPPEEPVKPIAPVSIPVELDAELDNILDTKPQPNLYERNRGIPTAPTPPAPQQQKQQFNQIKMEQTQPNKNKNVTKYSRPTAYSRPPIDLLTTVSTPMDEGADDFQTKALILEQTLENFKIPAKVKGITHGPAVTRYELQMPPGIPVKRISQHADDIAMTLEASGAVRIEAPIPGKGLVGIEVPNAVIATIGLRDIIDSQEFLSNKAPLVFALGKDIAGSIKVCDLNSMPHLLVAGSTGSGKSVCLNTIILSFLYKLSPHDLKLILIDPKRVEFTTYNNLPHMMLPDAITDPEQALNALNWAIKEMERRYETFASHKVRDFKEYNALEAVYNGTEPKLPRIVIVVDELADLMMTAKRDMEEKIKRLAQLARAAGMHLIIATQRPSVDVITGTIKSNLPSRIAFAVTNFADSKTILDGGGADKLLGKGDMLYAPQNLPEPIRVQGAYVTNTEVEAVCEYIKAHNDSNFDSDQTELILNGEKQEIVETGNNNAGNGGSEFDPLLPQALKMFLDSGQASISLIQRRYSVGFAKAARIVDQMELAGFIAPSDGSSKNRTILITHEKYEELFGGYPPQDENL